MSSTSTLSLSSSLNEGVERSKKGFGTSGGGTITVKWNGRGQEVLPVGVVRWDWSDPSRRERPDTPRPRE